MTKFILSMEDIEQKPQLLDFVGRKFAGLYDAHLLISEIREKADILVRIPKTFVISSKVFDEIKPKSCDELKSHFDNLAIPPEVLFQTANLLVACGGSVALRSSSNLEDGSDKAYSGACETYLNVKPSEIAACLRENYRSLYNPVMIRNCEDISKLKMSVIIQEMIKTPKMAGVIYSQTFENDEKGADGASSVIHFVEDDTAERMIVGQGGGQIKKMPKYITSENIEKCEVCGIERLNDNKEYSRQRDILRRTYQKGCPEYENAFRQVASMELSALVAYFENKKQYPVDMEFAVTVDKESGRPVIHVLQQRKYNIKENFKIRSLDNMTVVGYNADDEGRLDGEVVVVEAPDPLEEGFDLQLPDMKDKIVLMRRQPFNELKKKYPDMSPDIYEVYLARTIMLHTNLLGNEGYCDAKAVIDNSGFILTAIYGHFGNELRQNGIPFVLSETADFDGLKNGDRIMLDVAGGKFEKEQEKNVRGQKHNLFSTTELGLKVLADKIFGRK